MTACNHDGDLVLFGAGKMGMALVEGFVRCGLDPNRCVAVDPYPSDAAKARLSQLGIRLVARVDDRTGPAPAVVLLAVKPQILSVVLPDVATLAGADRLVVSVLAGIPLSSLSVGLPTGQAIVRAMPNTPAALGAGITVCIANAHVTTGQRAHADALLRGAGVVAWIEDETEMDAVTAVSGSGPAYVFHFVEALTEAGVQHGLERSLAQQLARATVAGSGALLDHANQSAGELRTAVTSPGGTTEAALKVLMEDDALMRLMARAVEAAKRRSEELAKPDES